MRKIPVRRMACGLVLLAGLALALGRGPEDALSQAPKTGDAPTAIKRVAYIAKYRQAKDLAEVLTKHYKTEAEILADPGSNCLLITSTSVTFDEMIKLLGQLDRRPQVVFVEVMVLEPLQGKAAGAKPGVAEKELEERDFSGPIDQVRAKVQALKKSGMLGEVRQLQLVGLENQPTQVTIGGAKPYTTGRTSGPGGKGASMISYRDMGTMLNVTPRVNTDKQIQLDLRLEDSRMSVPEDGIQIGTTDDGKPIRATEFILSNLKANLSMTSGQAVLAKEVRVEAKTGQARTLVIVSARIVE